MGSPGFPSAGSPTGAQGHAGVGDLPGCSPAGAAARWDAASAATQGAWDRGDAPVPCSAEGWEGDSPGTPLASRGRTGRWPRPFPRQRGAGTPCRGERAVLTQLLDAFLVLDEELHPRDVDVQAGALRRALHRRVKAAVILAVR